MSEGSVRGVFKAIIVNENGEYQYVDDVDLSSLNVINAVGSEEVILDGGGVGANAGIIANEVEVVSLDDFERRHRAAALLQQRGNSTCTTQSIVKPLVSSLPTSPVPASSAAGPSTVVASTSATTVVRSMPTLLRNSRVVRQPAFGTAATTTVFSPPPPATVISGTLPHQIPDVVGIGSTPAAATPVPTIEYVDIVQEGGEDMKFVPGNQQVIIYSSEGGEYSVIPEDQLQICIQQNGQVFTGGEIVQLSDQGDLTPSEEGKTTTTVQYIYQDGTPVSVGQPTISTEEQEVIDLPEEPEPMQMPASSGITQGTLVEDEDGNVYEVEQVMTETPVQEAIRTSKAKTNKRQTKREAARKVVKIPGYPNMVATIRKKGSGKGLKCQETDCYYEGGNIGDLKNHLRRSHEMEFDEEIITFKDYNEFKRWRQVYEKERMVSFIFRGGTKRISKDQSVTYLICHRSGHYKPTIQDQSRKRRLKPQGSCKMNGHCTSGIKMLKNTDTGEVRIEICHTHYGHPLDNGAIPHLRANNELRKVIWKKFQEGMTFTKVVEYLHHNPEQIEGIRLLDRRAIRNLYDKFKKNEGKSIFGDDFENIEKENPSEVGENERDTLLTEEDDVEPDSESEPSEKPEEIIVKVSDSTTEIILESEIEPTEVIEPAVEDKTEKEKAHNSFAEVAKLVLVKPENQPASEVKEQPEPEVRTETIISTRARRGLRRGATADVPEAKRARTDEEEKPSEDSKSVEVEQGDDAVPPRRKRGRPPKTSATTSKLSDHTSQTSKQPIETALDQEDVTQPRRSGRERKPKLLSDDEVSPLKPVFKFELLNQQKPKTKRRKTISEDVPQHSEDSSTAPPTLEPITEVVAAGTSDDQPPPVLEAEHENDIISPPSSSKAERRKPPTARYRDDSSDVIVGDGLEQTITNLLKQSDSGPTVLLYKNSSSPEPVFGSHPELFDGDFILIIQSPVQRQILQQFPDIINVDAHLGKSRDLKLAWIMILDEYREAIPVAWLICSSVEERTLRIFFDAIKSECGELDTKYIMAPANRDYHGTWSSVFSSNPSMLLNEEDTKRDLRVEIADYFPDTNVRRSLDDFINKMMYATRIEAFKTALANMKKYLDRIPSGAEFYRHFQDTWSPRSEQWSLFGCIDKPVNTLYVSESFGKVKKFISFKGTRMLNFNIDPILKTSYDKCFARTKRLYKGDQKIQDHMTEIDSHHAAGCLIPPESFSAAQHPNHYLVNDGSKNVSYTVLDLRSPCRCRFVCSGCNICIHKYMCSCVTSCLNHQMCQHIHFVHMMLAATTQEVDGQLVSAEILPEGYEVQNNSGILEQYEVADALVSTEAGQSGTVVTVVQLGNDQEILSVH